MPRAVTALFGSLLSVFCLLLLTGAIVNSGGAPSGRTGAPGASTCATSGCHASFGLNEDGGSATISAPSTWEPGTPVDLALRIERSGAARFGFSITVQDVNGDMVGSWELVSGQGTAFSAGGADLTHLTHSPAVNVDDEHTWLLRWVPPAEDVGPVTFYAAGNAANGAQGSAGDYIYTTSLTLPSATATERWQVVPFRVESAYPLPAEERLTLDVQADRSMPVSVFIYDATGRSRLVQHVNVSRGANRLNIDTSSLSAGTYLWRVEMEGHSDSGVLPIVR